MSSPPRAATSAAETGDPPRHAEAPREDAAHGREDAQGSPDVLRLLTSVGSPIALATALLYYFGWVRSEAQARAFGADASVFAMSTHDYVIRSVNVLFFPVILLLLLGLLVLRLDRRLRHAEVPPRWVGPVTRALRYSWALFLPLGLVLYSVAGTFGDVTLPFWVVLAILGPSYGVVLRRLATGDRERFSTGAVVLVALLLTVCLFWQTERLAKLGGRATAQDIKDRISERLMPVELFSAKDLHLAGGNVLRRDLGGTDSAYRYHYSGLYLLQRSGDKYFLLTDGWDDGMGRLLVIPDTAAIRLEFGGS